MCIFPLLTDLQRNYINNIFMAYCRAYNTLTCSILANNSVEEVVVRRKWVKEMTVYGKEMMITMHCWVCNCDK